MNFDARFYLYLAVFVIPAVLAGMAYLTRKYRNELKSFSDEKMYPVLFDVQVFKARKTKNILLVLVIFFLLLTLAGPRFGTKLVNIKRKSIDIIIALDCSKSMLAEDILPNRMSKVKDLFSILIDRLKENRIGVLAFSGVAFTQCPLTYDNNAAKMLLGMIDTNLIPFPGTSLGSAIKLATKSFGEDKYSNKVLVLLTDGEDHKSDPLDAAQEARDYGIRIFTVGIGTTRGEVIPMKDENGNTFEYKRNKKGEVVASKLDENTLMQIAQATDGKYYSLSYADTGVVEQLLDDLNNIEKKETKSGVYNLYEHRFQYTLLIAIVLLLIEMFIPEIKKQTPT
ncbi:MAG: VWA domain-containing protein [Elusimicrobia bacterium]|nr:VWA domain-containing protein [Elusimicrobiota bacterium]